MVLSGQEAAENLSEAQQVASGLLVGSDRANAQRIVQAFWRDAREQFNAHVRGTDQLSDVGQFEEMVSEAYAARYLDLDDPVAQVVGNTRDSWTAPLPESGRMKGSPFQPRTYVAVPDGPNQTNIFMGEELVPPAQHPKGLGVREQMVEIGKRVYGSEFQDIFKKDFFEVIPRYGQDLARRVRHQRWFNENLLSLIHISEPTRPY